MTYDDIWWYCFERYEELQEQRRIDLVWFERYDPQGYVDYTMRRFGLR